MGVDEEVGVGVAAADDIGGATIIAEDDADAAAAAAEVDDEDDIEGSERLYWMPTMRKGTIVRADAGANCATEEDIELKLSRLLWRCNCSLAP